MRQWGGGGSSARRLLKCTTFYHGDRIYVMSALTGRCPKETTLETAYLVDPAQDTWWQGPPIPEGRRRGGAGTAVYGGRIFVACGIVDGHTSGTVA